uniref:uncharacterized protein LOC122610435 n=1 Tax=Erigeron canadensis TaxID=72917 RepID=UPI001CB8A371|nr:uncharacterized protein LOC122610435 [Erigeron canadensis]
MGRNKATCPDQIPIEAWRCLGDVGIRLLTSLFNKIWTSAKMPEEWRLSEVIPIYKNKGDVQSCSNYRGIKLLSHTMKLWERVIDMRLRRVTKVAENQFSFMPDLEKAYDSVPRQLIWRTLQAKGVKGRYIRVIRDMYDRERTGVRTPVGNTELFSVDMDLHQGSALSPYLFTLILDELSRGLEEELRWCVIFADDIALIARSTEELNQRLEKWREALEDHGLCMSREKTKYLRCDFDNQEIRQNGDEVISIGGHILRPKESLEYAHKSGGIDEDVTHRIQVGWMKWRAATGVMCDKRIPLKLKEKFYRVAIRPTMLYGSECWAMTKAQAARIEVDEMRMLRWTCGKTLADRIPTGVFRAELEVRTIINKLREERLRWFGHVRRRDETAPLRRAESIHVDGIRRRGRPKMRWGDRLAKDLIELGLSEDMTSDRTA